MSLKYFVAAGRRPSYIHQTRVRRLIQKSSPVKKSSLFLLAKERPKSARVEAAYGDGPSNDVAQGHGEQIGQKKLRPSHAGAQRHAERNQEPCKGKVESRNHGEGVSELMMQSGVFPSLVKC